MISVPKFRFTGSKCVRWFLDKAFQSNPLTLYGEKPVVVQLAIFSDPTLHRASERSFLLLGERGAHRGIEFYTPASSALAEV